MAFSEEEKAYGFVNFDDEFLVEEWQEGGKMRFLVDYEDVDLLPSDPFGMELNDPFRTNFNLKLPSDPFSMDFTVAAITGCVGDFGQKAYGFESDGDNGNEDNNLKPAEVNVNNDKDNQFLAKMNFVLATMNEVVRVDPVMYVQDGYYDDHTTDDLMCFGCEIYGPEPVKVDSDGAVNTIVFVLEHLNLDVKDLLSVERVCKSLREAVRKDPYLWTSIHIDHPSSENITDEDLLQLTDRAQGKLRRLSLLQALKISKDGLKLVLERNLELTELSVAGSTNLSGEGFLHNLKLFNSVARPGIKHLRIGNPIGLENEHLQEYKLLLGAEENAAASNYEPRFHRLGEIHLSLDDERAIDIEICPRCQKLGQVFDCTTENCQLKVHPTKTCRACIKCISRCIRCGCCLFNKRYEETFCFDCVCIDCLEELFLLDVMKIPPEQAYLHQLARCHFFFYA